jgi:hypothetical protein
VNWRKRLGNCFDDFPPYIGERKREKEREREERLSSF